MQNRSNQTFDEMNRVALQWLNGRDPREIADKAGVFYDDARQCFCFSSMGTALEMTWPDCRITPQVGAWHYLLILHYLHLADGTPVAGREMSFSQMVSGMVRGGGIDSKFERGIQRVKNLDEAMLERICAAMGAERLQTNADISYCIPFLPHFPVTLKVWLPDEDFPASGRLLVDESADHYFTIEDAVTLAEILIDRITVPAEQQSFANQ